RATSVRRPPTQVLTSCSIARATPALQPLGDREPVLDVDVPAVLELRGDLPDRQPQAADAGKLSAMSRRVGGAESRLELGGMAAKDRALSTLFGHYIPVS